MSDSEDSDEPGVAERNAISQAVRDLARFVVRAFYSDDAAVAMDVLCSELFVTLYMVATRTCLPEPQAKRILDRLVRDGVLRTDEAPVDNDGVAVKEEDSDEEDTTVDGRRRRAPTEKTVWYLDDKWFVDVVRLRVKKLDDEIERRPTSSTAATAANIMCGNCTQSWTMAQVLDPTNRNALRCPNCGKSVRVPIDRSGERNDLDDKIRAQLFGATSTSASGTLRELLKALDGKPLEHETPRKRVLHQRRVNYVRLAYNNARMREARFGYDNTGFLDSAEARDYGEKLLDAGKPPAASAMDSAYRTTREMPAHLARSSVTNKPSKKPRDEVPEKWEGALSELVSDGDKRREEVLASKLREGRASLAARLSGLEAAGEEGATGAGGGAAAAAGAGAGAGARAAGTDGGIGGDGGDADSSVDFDAYDDDVDMRVSSSVLPAPVATEGVLAQHSYSDDGTDTSGLDDVDDCDDTGSGDKLMT